MKCAYKFVLTVVAALSLVRCTNSRLKLEDHKSKLLQLVALSYKPPQPPDHHVTDSISVSGAMQLIVQCVCVCVCAICLFVLNFLHLPIDTDKFSIRY